MLFEDNKEIKLLIWISFKKRLHFLQLRRAIQFVEIFRIQMVMKTLSFICIALRPQPPLHVHFSPFWRLKDVSWWWCCFKIKVKVSQFNWCDVCNVLQHQESLLTSLNSNTRASRPSNTETEKVKQNYYYRQKTCSVVQQQYYRVFLLFQLTVMHQMSLDWITVWTVWNIFH